MRVGRSPPACPPRVSPSGRAASHRDLRQITTRDTVAWRDGECEEGRPDEHGETGWFPPAGCPMSRDGASIQARETMSNRGGSSSAIPSSILETSALSSPIILRHFAADRFDQAAELLAGLHPVDEARLREVFTKMGRPFEPFWDLAARTRAVQILTGEQDVIRPMLGAALVALAGEKSWTLPHGLALPIHAIVGVDPARLSHLYRMSGGPPAMRAAATGGSPSDDLARPIDARIDPGFDIGIPARFAPQPDEHGLRGAWDCESLQELQSLLEGVASRQEIDERLAARERGWWARFSGEAARCAELRAGVDGAWADWMLIVEAVKTSASADGYLGVETR